MSSSKKVEENTLSFYGFIGNKNGVLKVTIVDTKTEKIVKKLSFIVKEKYENVKVFVQNIPSIFTKNFKTVIIQLFEFETSEYPNNYQFCKVIRNYFDFIKIPYYFISGQNYLHTTLLAASNITAKVNDYVSFVSLINDDYIVEKYQFSENGHNFFGIGKISSSRKPEIIKKQFLGFTNSAPKIVPFTLIFGSKNNAAAEKLQNVMPISDGFVVVDIQENGGAEIQGIVEISKWILDNKNIKCYFLPKCCTEFLVVGKYGGKILPNVLTKLNSGLPSKNEGLFARSNIEYFEAYSTLGRDYVYLSQLHLDKNCHRYNIICNVDINNFVFYQVKTIIIEQIKNLPTTLNKIVDSKIPVIGFPDNLSFMCICGDDGYKFVDEWNGVYGEELFISFADEKPKYCRQAVEDCKIKPTSVIFDILKILSMPANQIEPHLSWTFKITKDSENPVLIEFDNFDGTKKAASPTLLMAMLLKEHLKVMKKESGKKPKEIAFWSLDSFNAEEKKLVKNALKEACKLLKVNCSFVDIDF
uniref:Tail specific protease domain-containing protein n=1 Tax=Panagrolaimus sp. ES5 TaxID=591445 RepID=A0AC34FTI7_9BILA